jgi:hypothetical protein
LNLQETYVYVFPSRGRDFVLWISQAQAQAQARFMGEKEIDDTHWARKLLPAYARKYV